MYIRRYSIGAILYMIFVGWFIYAFITRENTPELTVLGLQIIEMPIALAFVIPLIALFVMTIAHMMFYSVLEYIQNIQNERDFQELEKAVKYNLMGQHEEKHNYRSKLYRDIGELLNNVKIVPKNTTRISDKSKFKNLIDIFEDLKKGEIVELKQYSSFMLDEMNAKNELKKDSKVSETLLLERGIYSDDLYRDAFLELVKFSPFNTIQKHIQWLTKDAFWEILKRIDSGENSLYLSREDILKFIAELKMTTPDYIKLAQVMKQENIKPELRLEIFKNLLDKTDDAQEGFIYTLFDLEMLSEVEAVLNDTQPTEFTNMKAYLLLKKNNFTFLDLYFFIKEEQKKSGEISLAK